MASTYPLAWAASALGMFAGCAYVMPASWRSFAAEPEDAPLAITRAVERARLSVALWDQKARRITTVWEAINSGVTETRERYVIRWTKEPAEGALTVFVRHEAQDREISDGRSTAGWGLRYHDGQKERRLLGRIARELAAMERGMPGLSTVEGPWATALNRFCERPGRVLARATRLAR